MMRVSVEVTVPRAHVDLAAPRELGSEPLTVQAGERVGTKEPGLAQVAVLEQRWGPERTAMPWVLGVSARWGGSSLRAQAQQAGKPLVAKPAVPRVPRVLGPPRDLSQAGKGHSYSG